MADLLIFLLIIALYTMGSVPQWLLITSIVIESISFAIGIYKGYMKAKK